MATRPALARLQPFGVIIAAGVALVALAIAIHQQFSIGVLGGPAVDAATMAPAPRLALPYVEPYRPPSAAEQALSIAVAGVPAELDEALRFERPETPPTAPASPTTVAAASPPAVSVYRPLPTTVAAAAPPPVSVYRPVRWRPPALPAKAPPVARVIANPPPAAESFDPLTPWFVTGAR